MIKSIAMFLAQEAHRIIRPPLTSNKVSYLCVPKNTTRLRTAVVSTHRRDLAASCTDIYR